VRQSPGRASRASRFRSAFLFSLSLFSPPPLPRAVNRPFPFSFIMPPSGNPSTFFLNRLPLFQSSLSPIVPGRSNSSAAFGRRASYGFFFPPSSGHINFSSVARTMVRFLASDIFEWTRFSRGPNRDPHSTWLFLVVAPRAPPSTTFNFPFLSQSPREEGRWVATPPRPPGNLCWLPQGFSPLHGSLPPFLVGRDLVRA